MESITVHVLAFGPLAEQMGGRSTSASVTKGTTIESLVQKLDLSRWLEFGLSVAVNGLRVTTDTVLQHEDEVALLPPVSGG